MTEVEILDRLAPVFAQEGLEVEMMGSREHCLLIRARRTRAGAPVAFLVKALEGTLRRYHETLREVELSEYDPGEDLGPAPAPSPELEKVLKHRAHSGAARLPARPGLDLSGCDRAQAARALEQAHKMWSGQVPRFWVKGCKEDAVLRAVQKWHHFQGLSLAWEGSGADVAEVVLDPGAPAPEGEEEVFWFPARLMLLGEAPP